MSTISKNTEEEVIREKLKQASSAVQPTDPKRTQLPEKKKKKSSKAKRVKKKKWPRRLAIAAVVGLLFLWLLPMIIAIPTIFNSVVSMAMPQINGSVQIQSASLGWFSPIQLKEIHLTDEQGSDAVVIAEFSSSKSLLGLIWNSDDLGVLKIKKPQLNLVVTENSSNLEEILAPLLQQESDSGSKIPSFKIELSDGQIQVTHRDHGDRWQLSSVNLEAKISQVDDIKIIAKLAGIAQHEQQTGEFNLVVDCILPATDDSQVATTVQATLIAKSFPLSVLNTVLTRWDENVKIHGRLNSTLQIAAKFTKKPKISASGNLTIDQAVFTCSALGKDQIRLTKLQIPCDIKSENGKVSVERLAFLTDIANVELQGKLDLAQLQNQNLYQALLHQAIQCKGNLDIAKLAKMLPNTLQIRQGTQISGGQMKWDLSLTSQSDKILATGQLELANLAAQTAKNQTIVAQPIKAILNAQIAQQGIILNKLEVQSVFMELAARGTPQQIHAQGHFNLGRLMTELSQFVELGDIRLAGDGKLNLSWSKNSDEVFSAYCQLVVNHLNVSLPQREPMVEEEVKLLLTAAGSLQDWGLKHLDTALLKLQLGKDASKNREMISGQLLKPVYQLDQEFVLPLKIQASGNLKNLISKLKPWVDFEETDLNGNYHLTIDSEYKSGLLTLSGGRINVNRFHYWTESLFIDEPQLQLSFNAKLDFTKGEYQCEQAVLMADAVTLRIKEFAYSSAVNAPSPQANIELTGKLEKLYAWIHNPNEVPEKWLTGNIKGKISANSAGEKYNITSDLSIHNFNVLSLTPDKQQPGRYLQESVWQEDKLQLVANASLDQQQDRLSVTKLEILSKALQLKLTAQIDELSKKQQLAVKGTIDYDLEKLGPLLQPYTGNNVKLEGKGPYPFEVNGSLAELMDSKAVDANQKPIPFSTRLANSITANLSFGWSKANLYGLDIGKAKIETKLADGKVSISPLDFTVNQGKFTFAPTVRLSPEPAIFYVPKGPLLTNVQLTPEMCRSGLRFINPFMAGATEVDGSISLELTGAMVPLSDPKNAQASGKLTIHSAQIGGSALAQQILPLVSVVPTTKIPLLQNVEFWVQDGKVYHRGVGIMVKGVPIQTEGWVAFDDTINIVATMPIPTQWLKDKRIADFFQGQSIRVPINGTISNPKLDRRALDQVKNQLLQQAIQKALEKQKLQNKIFDFLPKP